MFACYNSEIKNKILSAANNNNDIESKNPKVSFLNTHTNEL
jgi:hypothetical protein